MVGGGGETSSLRRHRYYIIASTSIARWREVRSERARRTSARASPWNAEINDEGEEGEEGKNEERESERDREEKLRQS